MGSNLGLLVITQVLESDQLPPAIAQNTCFMLKYLDGNNQAHNYDSGKHILQNVTHFSYSHRLVAAKPAGRRRICANHGSFFTTGRPVPRSLGEVGTPVSERNCPACAAIARMATAYADPHAVVVLEPRLAPQGSVGATRFCLSLIMRISRYIRNA